MYFVLVGIKILKNINYLLQFNSFNDIQAMTFKAEVDHQEVEVASIGADGVDSAVMGVVEGVALPTTAAKTFVEVSWADAVLVMLGAVIPEQAVFRI